MLEVVGSVYCAITVSAFFLVIPPLYAEYNDFWLAFTLVVFWPLVVPVIMIKKIYKYFRNYL